MSLRKNPSIKRFSIVFVLISCILLTPLFIQVIYCSFNMSEQEINDTNHEILLLKSSQSFTLSNITIDDLDPTCNWENITAENDWCNGNGTKENPYIIENVTIDGSGLPPGNSCIIIQNSQAHFIIRNCTLKNAPVRGIWLNNVSNGQIIDNNCSFNNESGIGINNGYNLNITLNILIDNDLIGIGLLGGSNNTFLKNLIQGSSSGLILITCENSTVHNNTIKNNDNGITISDSIFVPQYSRLNNITQNVIINSSNVGINLTSNVFNNLLYNNTLISNFISAIDDNGLNFWNSSNIGNYWDDYDGFDLNEDGRGETPYIIYNSSGVLTSYDYLPIWDIPDEIDPIITPKISNNIFGKTAPVINIEIDEYDLNDTWYTIDGGEINYYFSGKSISIDQNLWNSLPDGIHTITIYARDSSDNIGSFNLNIIKAGFLTELTLIIIITIIIISIIGFGSVSVYQFVFKPFLLDKKKTKDIIRQWNSEKHVPDKFSIARTSYDIDILKNDDFTLVSEQFMAKVDKLNFSPEEKEEFLKDMLSMNPKMRNEFIDELLKKQ